MESEEFKKYLELRLSGYSRTHTLPTMLGIHQATPSCSQICSCCASGNYLTAYVRGFSAVLTKTAETIPLATKLIEDTTTEKYGYNWESTTIKLDEDLFLQVLHAHVTDPKVYKVSGASIVNRLAEVPSVCSIGTSKVYHAYYESLWGYLGPKATYTLINPKTWSSPTAEQRRSRLVTPEDRKWLVDQLVVPIKDKYLMFILTKEQMEREKTSNIIDMFGGVRVEHGIPPFTNLNHSKDYQYDYLNFILLKL